MPANFRVAIGTNLPVLLYSAYLHYIRCMCYDVSARIRKLKKLEQRYGKLSVNIDKPNRPQQQSAFSNSTLPVVTPNAPDQVKELRWGFVPAFAKDAKQAKIWLNRSYNCRADSLKSKIEAGQHSMFKPVSNNPTVILIDGFYEWHTASDGTKYPYFIRMKDQETFAVAGLQGYWNDMAEPERQYTGTTLCTTAANGLLAKIHNKPAGSEDFRMPGILLPEDITTWLDTELSVIERLALIKPYPADEMEAFSVINYKKKENRAIAETSVVTEPFNYPVAEVKPYLDGGVFV